MDKQDSHENQISDKDQQRNSSDMSTHGEIHKQKISPGAASVSLDPTLTSALSRAPSPFEAHTQNAGEPAAALAQASQAPHDNYTTAPKGSGYPSAPQEPQFSSSAPQTPLHDHASEQHYEPSFDEIYSQDQHAETQPAYPHGQAQDHIEPGAYPAQYNQYQDGMSDVFDESAEKPHSRRTSFMLLASLALVAIIAGGVIYFYKSQTTDVASNGEIPVIKAEETPTKITPEKPGGIEIPHQKKLIYDRITGGNTESSEQIIPRQEAVIPVTPQTSTGNPFDQQQALAQSTSPDTPVSAPGSDAPKAKPVLPPSISEPSPPAASPAPIALSPPAGSSPSTPVISSSGDYLIQIASFRTQQEAVRNYENLSRKYSGLLSSYGPLIQKADLGSRGIYYRLRIGPMDTKETAQNLCSNLVAQGQKDCLVRRK